MPKQYTHQFSTLIASLCDWRRLLTNERAWDLLRKPLKIPPQWLVRLASGLGAPNTTDRYDYREREASLMPILRERRFLATKGPHGTRVASSQEGEGNHNRWLVQLFLSWPGAQQARPNRRLLPAGVVDPIIVS